MPRPYTVEEIQKQLIEHAWALVDYWSELPGKTVQERVSGAVFSLLVILDGEGGGLPGFQVIPAPHPDDREWHEQRGYNWYPSDPDSDIAGPLHEIFIRARRAADERTQTKGS